MSNGVLFKGLSSKKHPLSGEGQLIYQDGSLYVGEIKKGQANGHGEKIWSQLQVLSMKGFTPNQSSQQDFQQSFTKTYKGNWVMGKMEGFGELTLS